MFVYVWAALRGYNFFYSILNASLIVKLCVLNTRVVTPWFESKSKLVSLACYGSFKFPRETETLNKFRTLHRDRRLRSATNGPQPTLCGIIGKLENMSCIDVLTPQGYRKMCLWAALAQEVERSSRHQKVPGPIPNTEPLNTLDNQVGTLHGSICRQCHGCMLACVVALSVR